MASTEHPLARRGLTVLVVVLVALAGMVGLLIFFNSRDDAPIAPANDAAIGPGQVYADLGHEHLSASALTPPYNSDPPTSGPHRVAPVTRDGVPLSDDQILHALELGNVILFYDAPAAPAALRRLVNDLSGPFDPALAAGGQAVILARRPGTRGVIAAAWRHLEPAPSASDPALREFADAWLGRGVGG
jgi:hypothetical protein